MNRELNKILLNQKFERIFILSGEKSFKNIKAKKYFSEVLKKKKYKIFYKKSFLPNLDELKIIIKNLKDFNPDLFIAIGGGCVLDYAKMANILDLKSNSASLIEKYRQPVKKKYTKLLAIPTTAGSGAEVTSNAVIYVNGVKYSIEHKDLIPDYYFLIPEFVFMTPKKIKSSAGFDAYAQAIESLFAVKSNDLSVEYSIKALKKINLSLTNYYYKPTLENSLLLAQGANLAGKAISISKTTLPHAISYPFSMHYNLSHGHAVSLFFEILIKYNYDNLNESNLNFDLRGRFNLLFKTLDLKNINDFLFKISELKKKLKLNDNLAELNINIQKDKNKILSGINFLRLNNNPISITPSTILSLIQK